MMIQKIKLLIELTTKLKLLAIMRLKTMLKQKMINPEK